VAIGVNAKPEEVGRKNAQKRVKTDDGVFLTTNGHEFTRIEFVAGKMPFRS
jgi:hypothetical protein